jgi:hypothetical protein
MKYQFNEKEVNAITLLLSIADVEAVKEVIQLNTHLTDEEIEAALVTLESLRIGIRTIASKNKIVHY